MNKVNQDRQVVVEEFKSVPTVVQEVVVSFRKVVVPVVVGFVLGVFVTVGFASVVASEKVVVPSGEGQMHEMAPATQAHASMESHMGMYRMNTMAFMPMAHDITITKVAQMNEMEILDAYHAGMHGHMRHNLT